MSKLKPCKSCGHEVAKSAKKCPHCGQTLKMGLMMKGFLGFVGLLVLMAVMRPSDEEQAARLQEQVAQIEAAVSSSLNPSELADIFSFGSKHTDVQRDNKEREIMGQIVDWSLPVFDVNKSGDRYRIQTKGSTGYVGTFIYLLPRNDDERSRIEALTEDDMIRIKGKIAGTMMRNIKLDPAILAR